MLFKDVIGQEKIKQLLLKLVETDRLPHAMLFLGAEGVGTLPMALAFAQYLLCTNRQATDACGQCAGCRKVSRLIHPDVHFSFPTVGTKVTSDRLLEDWRTALLHNPYLNLNQWLRQIGQENKQGNINVDECNAIIRKISLKIFEGEYKILIMWMAEALGREGNRLLKLIEEPPENTVIILIAEDQELILNTVLSRCQLLKFPALKDEAVIEALHGHYEVPKDQAHALAHLANGNYNEAITLANTEENDFAELFVNWLRTCYVGNGVELVEYVNKIAPIGREQQKHFLKYGLHFLRELLMTRLREQEDARLRPEELNIAKKLAAVVDEWQIEAMSKQLSEGIFHVERNANPKILFLDISIGLHKIFKQLEPAG